jgi:hypothetical protein
VRPFALALFATLAAALPAFADSAAFPYTPPTAPPAPDLGGVLLRLGGLTALTLLLCGGVIVWARRAARKRLLAPNTSGRMVLDARLPLDAQNAVLLLRVDGHPVIVTTDASGLRAIVPVQPSFEAALADADPEPEPPAPTPPAAPPG